jgi:hypothetical membrane protein
MIFIILSVVFIISAILIAQLFMPPAYHWTNNTISELASQGLPFRWIMQIGFIGFGVLLNTGLLLKSLSVRKIIYPDLLIIAYGIAVLITGFFSAEPFIPETPYSTVEANIHTTFASVAGFFLTIAIVLAIFSTSDSKEKLVHTLFCIGVIGLSAAFGFAENRRLPVGKGLVQRTLWAVSFFWLLYGQYLSFQKLR